MPYHSKEQYFNTPRKPKKSEPQAQWTKVCFWRKRSQKSNKNQQHPACNETHRPQGPDRRTKAYKNRHHEEENAEDFQQNQEDYAAQQPEHGDQYPEEEIVVPVRNPIRKPRSRTTSTDALLGLSKEGIRKNPLKNTRSGVAGRTRFSQRKLGGGGFIDHELGDLILNGGR